MERKSVTCPVCGAHAQKKFCSLWCYLKYQDLKREQGWAERHVLKRRQVLNHLTDDEFMLAVLKAEHARSVRIVLRLMKQAEKEHRFNQYNAMAEVLTALQRGRGGKG